MIVRVMLGVILAGGSLTAQLPVGTVGATMFSTTAFATIDPTQGSATSTTIYTTTGFQGTLAPSTSQCILQDILNPDSFIVGGYGFMGRVTITGPGTATYTPIALNTTTTLNRPVQMSWDANNTIIVGDGGTDQIRRVDPTTGAITDLTVGAQPWDTTLNACVIRPWTGEIYASSMSGLYRIPAGGGPAQLLAHGWAPGLSVWSAGLALDPFTSDIFVTVLSPAHRILRVNALTGDYVDVIPPGAISSPNSIAIDQNGDLIVGATANSVWRVPNAGGTPTLLGTITGIGNGSASGVTVLGGVEGGPPSATPFTLDVVTTGTGGGTLSVNGVPSTATEGWTFLSANTTWTQGSGWFAGIVPDGLTFFVFSLFPQAQPGNPLHWVAGVPGLFPSTAFQVPPGTFPIGQNMDIVVLALGASLSPVGITEVDRVTW
jgi:hypothetical protein